MVRISGGEIYDIKERFNSEEEIAEEEITNEFCQGEQARTRGASLSGNPYHKNRVDWEKSVDWAKGWCGRDMVLSSVQKTVIINGSEYVPRYAICGGCPQLGNGGFCSFEQDTKKCAYPDKFFVAVGCHSAKTDKQS